MRVYHFLPAENALSDIALARMKISRFDQLNDPFELLAPKLFYRERAKLFRHMKSHITSRLGVLCFTKNWENPLLWSHYADAHRGACLGFDVPDSVLFEVNYVSSRLEFKKLFASRKMPKRLELALATSKFEGWKYEEEIRMLVALAGKKRSKPEFHDFGSSLTLAEVILGAFCHLPAKGIAALLTQGYSNVRLTKARLAFNTFRVVIDKRATKKFFERVTIKRKKGQ